MMKTISQKEIDKQNDIAWQIRDSGSLESLELAKTTLKQAKQIAYTKGIAESLHIVCYGQATKTAEYDQARVNGQNALAIFTDIDDKVARQRVLNTLGLVEGISGNLTKAIEFFDRSLLLANELDLILARAKAFHNLAVAYEGINDFDISLDYYLKAIEIYENANDTKNVYKALQNIGVIHYNLENYDEALNSLLKTVEIYKDSNDKNTRGLAFLNIGRSYHKLNDYKKALDYLEQSIIILEQAGNRPGLSDALAEIGLVYMDMKMFTEAKDYITKSIKSKKALNDAIGLASSHYFLGKLYFEQNQKPKALKTLLKALNLAQKAQAKLLTQDINKELANSYKIIKNYKKAYRHLSEHVKIRAELFERDSYNRTQTLLVRHKIAQDDKDREIMRRNRELQIANENLKILTQRLEKQTKEDSLTKLYNRRHFDNILEKEFKRSHRYQKPLAVMICDIDNFKQVNDKFSHSVGDQVLIQIAQIFKNNIRANDTIARFGGEEFIALFPESNADKALEICERLRISVEKHPWHKINPELKITISIGICDDKTLANGEAMISKADDALYEVKESGKNSTKIWNKKQTLIA
ncbi:MAG TPA: diguanylate cyclase [Trueperaceae bacterium]|nr:diguanylate cyclase [Trueperaceae bacterium]